MCNAQWSFFAHFVPSFLSNLTKKMRQNGPKSAQKWAQNGTRWPLCKMYFFQLDKFEKGGDSCYRANMTCRIDMDNISKSSSNVEHGNRPTQVFNLNVIKATKLRKEWCGDFQDIYGRILELFMSYRESRRAKYLHIWKTQKRLVWMSLAVSYLN